MDIQLLKGTIQKATPEIHGYTTKNNTIHYTAMNIFTKLPSSFLLFFWHNSPNYYTRNGINIHIKVS